MEIIKIEIFLKLKFWGLGIGDWGLGIGDWAQSPIPTKNLIYLLINKTKIYN